MLTGLFLLTKNLPILFYFYITKSHHNKKTIKINRRMITHYAFRASIANITMISII